MSRYRILLATQILDPVPVPFSLLYLSPGSQLPLLPCPQAADSEILGSLFLWKGTPLYQPTTVCCLAGAVSGDWILALLCLGT